MNLKTVLAWVENHIKIRLICAESYVCIWLLLHMHNDVSERGSKQALYTDNNLSILVNAPFSAPTA